MLPARDTGFAVRVPRGFAARMRRGDPADPLLLQVLPQAAELIEAMGYSLDAVGDMDARVAGGVLQTFVSGVLGAEGLAFGPGGAWGSDLHVADANLTSLGSSGAAANGTGGISG